MENNPKDNGVFCILPWTHLAVRTNGVVSPCSWGIRIGNEIFDEKNNVSKYPNIEYIDKLKENMLAGNKSEFCTRCYEQESLCGISQRTKETFKHQIDKTDKVLNGETVNIAELELRLGNMCNIGCISCSPLSSNYFIREIEKYQPDLSKFEKKIGYHYSFLKDKEFDWFKDKNFWNTIEKHLPDITYIYLAGGEPTIIKENWEFLERVIELGYSKNIKLGISTNLTNMNKRHIEIYNSFKTCFVYCSIDGVNEVNDYVRYPSKWSQVEKNLQQLISNSNDTVEIKVVPVISILTIWKLPELWNYIEELKNKVNPKVSITSHTLLRDPAWLSLQNLPREGKLKALEIINKMLNEKKVDVEIKKIQKYLESSLDIGNTEEFYQGQQYIEEFEKMRENSWEYAIPELKDLWNKQC